MENKLKIIIIMIIIIIASISCIYFLNYKNSYEYNLDDENEIFENTDDKQEEVSKIKIYIIGEVRKPGVIELDYESRLEDAIILAGGTTEKSDLSRLNLASTLEDGMKVVVPSIEDSESNFKENAELTLENLESEKNNKININTATVNEFINLPGVGESLAKKIIEYRKENGKFKSIEDLKNISGIGEKKFESLKNYIKI